MPSCQWKHVLRSHIFEMNFTGHSPKWSSKMCYSSYKQNNLCLMQFCNNSLKAFTFYSFGPFCIFISLAKFSQIYITTGNNCTLYPFFAAIKFFSSIYTYNHLLVIYCSGQSVFWNFNIPYNHPHSLPLYCPLVCSFSICATFLVDKAN